MKKVAVLGSGVVGITLAKGFEKHGYPVVMGTQHPEKKVDWNGEIYTFAAAAQQAEILVLAVKGGVAEKVAQEVAPHASGKTVIDATNPISDAPPQNGVLKFFTTLDDSLLERLQRLVPQANFVKALNSVGNNLMINPEIKGGPPTMFICGNNPQAKAEVDTILKKFGWETEDMGSAEAARAIEPLCMLWCIRGFAKNQWTHAFKLLKN